jgi:hypothetical protein
LLEHIAKAMDLTIRDHHILRAIRAQPSVDRHRKAR